MKLTVYIPTRGRIGLNRQVTLREFNEYSSVKPILVCPTSEVSIHREYWPYVLACDGHGTGPTRQWILDHSKADIVVMADDDMRFSYRPDPAIIKLERCFDLDPMLALIERCVKAGYIHGGVSARQGNQHKDGSGPRNGVLKWGHMVQDCDRMCNFHFLYRPRIKTLGVRYLKGIRPDGVQETMEDFYLTLGLLTRGWPNRIIYTYAWNQEGSGSSGGCSTYRTEAIQQAWCKSLHESFPGFVRLVKKKSKDTSPAWREFKERTDVVIQWMKAYESANGDRK